MGTALCSFPSSAGLAHLWLLPCPGEQRDLPVPAWRVLAAQSLPLRAGRAQNPSGCISPTRLHFPHVSQQVPSLGLESSLDRRLR